MKMNAEVSFEATRRSCDDREYHCAHGKVIEVLPDGRCVIELEVNSQFVRRPPPPQAVPEAQNLVERYDDAFWEDLERRRRDVGPVWNPEEDNLRGGK